MKFMSEEFSSALGLTILDAFWQGALLLIIALVFISLFKQVSPRIKYRLIVAIMLAMPIWSLISFNNHYVPVSHLDIDVAGVIMQENVVATDTPSMTFSDKSKTTIVKKAITWVQSNANFATYFWLIGIAVFALRLLGGLAYVRILRKSAVDFSGKHWNTRAVELARQLDINRTIRLAESVKTNSPIVIGYLKPIVIFPLGLIQGMPTDQVEAILTHEMAHIKREDFLINLLLSALQVVYFFNPAYWWLYAQAEQEREYHCDLLAIDLIGNKLSLIKALASIQELRLPILVPAPGFAKGKNQLLERVLRITEGRPKTNWLSGIASVLLLVLSMALISWQNKAANGFVKTNDFENADLINEKPPLEPLYLADSALLVDEQILDVGLADTIPPLILDSAVAVIFENAYETILTMAMSKYKSYLSAETKELIEIVEAFPSDQQEELYATQLKALKYIKEDVDKAQIVEEAEQEREIEELKLKMIELKEVSETLRVVEELEPERIVEEKKLREIEEQLVELEDEKKEIVLKEIISEKAKEQEELSRRIELLELETLKTTDYLSHLKEEEKYKKVEESLKYELLKDELLPDGWGSLELTSKVLKINGKKQSSSIHKKYLRLYEKTMNEKLKKGATFELREN